MSSEELKEVSFSVSSTPDGGTKRKRGRPSRKVARNEIKDEEDKPPVGVSVIKTESVILKAKPGADTPVGKKVATQQVIKLLPKPNGTLQAKTIKADKQVINLPAATAVKQSGSGATIHREAPITRKTKVAILPKKKIMKLKLVGKPSEEQKPKPPAGTKISLPIKHKTRKCFKERRLRIEL